ncbi:MAG TPA: hypothetical protein VK816_03345 [Jatrophihabitantaceae bacterium]|nr:hypothetical protein [Jatrophihabitantaceae bacterium]
MALIVLMSSTACVSQGHQVNGLTIAQVQRQLDDYVKESVAALPAGAVLGATIGDPQPSFCDDSDGADSGPVNA